MKKMNIDDYDKVKRWSYSLARKWVIENLVSHGVDSARKFDKYKREGNLLPAKFPRMPDEYFQRRGFWKGWSDFFGNPVHSHAKNFVDYEEFKRLTIEAGIKNSTDYRAWKEKPSTLPSRPELYYEEWEEWRVFLKDQYKQKNYKTNLKLKVSDVRIIKQQLLLGVSGAALAKHFGVSEMQISRIKSGENWDEV